MRYEIYENDTLINTIIADEAFVTAYCEKHGYTYKAAEIPQTLTLEPQTFTPEPQTDDVYAELAKAIREGVNSI